MIFIELIVTFRNHAWSFVKTEVLLKALAVTDVVLNIGYTFAVTSAEC